MKERKPEEGSNTPGPKESNTAKQRNSRIMENRGSDYKLCKIILKSMSNSDLTLMSLKVMLECMYNRVSTE